MKGVYSYDKLIYYLRIYWKWKNNPRMFCAIMIEDGKAKTDEEAESIFRNARDHMKLAVN